MKRNVFFSLPFLSCIFLPFLVGGSIAVDTTNACITGAGVYLENKGYSGNRPPLFPVAELEQILHSYLQPLHISVVQLI